MAALNSELDSEADNTRDNVQIVEESDSAGESGEETDSNGAENDHDNSSQQQEPVEQTNNEPTELLSTPPTPQIQPQLPNLALQALERLRAAANKRKEDSPDDFRPLKKRRIGKKNECESDDNNTDADEGQCCSICLEPWSNSGIHRIASLKCGHLFGYGCIDKWLKTKDGRCPQCNGLAKKKDIRVIFAKSISVVDTTEKDRALKELEEEKMLRISTQKSEAQTLLQYQLAKAECDRVKQQLKELQDQLTQYRTSANINNTDEGGVASNTIVKPVSDGGTNGQFELIKTIAVNGNSRVMASNTHLGMMVASKKSTNQLYPGYGLIKISSFDLKSSEFVPIHRNEIRDIVFSPRKGDALTLTASVDKELKLTSMQSNTVVQSYPLPCSSWACSWNQDDSNYVYCGLTNGSLLTFDLRQTSGQVADCKVPNRSCPVTSLKYVPICRASCLNCSGLLMGTLEGAIFWESDTENLKPYILDSLCGPCMSVSFESISRHCLSSFRPSKNNSFKSRHIVCQLQNTPVTEPFSCNPLHSFEGGSSHSVLYRSLLFQKPFSPGKLMVAYGNGQHNQAHICDFSSTSELQVLRTKDEPCLDVSILEGEAGNTPTLLNLLTKSKLHVYKWNLS